MFDLVLSRDIDQPDFGQKIEQNYVTNYFSILTWLKIFARKSITLNSFMLKMFFQKNSNWKNYLIFAPILNTKIMHCLYRVFPLKFFFCVMPFYTNFLQYTLKASKNKKNWIEKLNKNKLTKIIKIWKKMQKLIRKIK